MTSIPATFLLPAEPGSPLDVTFRHEALRMSVVDRDQVTADVLRPWGVTGFYLLFGPAADETPGRYAVYVGKAAPGSIAGRIRHHVRNKEGWDRALLVTRSTDDGLNSTDVGWLEGRLHELLNQAEDAELLNSTTPGDDTISEWDRTALERVVTLTASIMRVLGYRPDPAPNAPTGTDNRPGRGEPDVAASGMDTSLLHELVAAVRAGEWTTYGDLAEAAGSHPRAIGSHIRHCGGSAPEWRVMNRRGESQPGFVWTATDGQGKTQVEYLAAEGLAFDDSGRADPDARVRSEQLLARIGTAANEDVPETAARQGGWLLPLVEAGLLQVGEQLVGRYRGDVYTAAVATDGSVSLRHGDTPLVGSPSLTAREVVGYEINGWTFWRHTDGEGNERPLSDLRDELG